MANGKPGRPRTNGKGKETSESQKLANKKAMLKNRERLNQIKDRPCMDCKGKFPPCCMDFDHRDPATKSFSIGSSVGMDINKLWDEIDKCDIVCANCHRIRTWMKTREEIEDGKEVKPGLRSTLLQ